ncbi:IS4 family transposase, partial [Emticicia agri]
MKGLYRLVNNSELNCADIIKSYRKGLIAYSLTQSLPDKKQYYYLFQDSTVGNYPTRQMDLGYLQTGSDNGVLIHNGILTDNHYVPLGLPIQEFIQRDRDDYGKRHQRHLRPFEEKESAKWIEAIDFARKYGRKTGISVVQVADKEADVAEVFNYALTHRQLFIINGRHDRKLKNSTQTLKPYLQSLTPGGIVERSLLDAKGKAHLCECQITFAKVDLQDLIKPIYVLTLQQLQPIKGQDLAHWMILTNVPVKTLAEAVAIIDTYTRRWTTCEDFHKCLKTGCSIQQRQLQSPQALFNTISLLSLIAIGLLRTRYLALKEHAQKTTNHLINELLSQDELMMADIAADKYLMPIDLTFAQKHTNLWFMLLLARMGGHQGIKQAGMPGWQTIWKGWIYFQALVDGLNMSKNLFLQK